MESDIDKWSHIPDLKKLCSHLTSIQKEIKQKLSDFLDHSTNQTEPS